VGFVGSAGTFSEGSVTVFSVAVCVGAVGSLVPSEGNVCTTSAPLPQATREIIKNAVNRNIANCFIMRLQKNLFSLSYSHCAQKSNPIKFRRCHYVKNQQKMLPPKWEHFPFFIKVRSCPRFWGRAARRGCLPYRSGTSHSARSPGRNRRDGQSRTCAGPYRSRSPRDSCPAPRCGS